MSDASDTRGTGREDVPGVHAPGRHADEVHAPGGHADEVHADEARPGGVPEGGELPGADVPAEDTSEELRPVQGLHVPEIGEEGRAVPGRYRTEH